MDAHLWIIIIVCLAVVALIFKDKAMDYFREKWLLNLSKSSYFRWVIGITVLIVFLIAFNSEPSISNYNESTTTTNSQNSTVIAESTTDSPKEYKKGVDVIRIIGATSNSYDLYTSRELGKSDVQLLKNALTYMDLNRNYTSFLYLQGKQGEDYYASFNGMNIHPKVTKEILNENLLSDLKSGMSISTKGDILLFLEKIVKAKSAINSNIANKEEFKKALISFQKTHFPKARKAYYLNAKEELWEKDIEVHMTGKNITFTGYHFSANKVIKDTYLEIKDELSKLRFKIVGFKAFDEDDKTYWELSSKSDTEL